MVSRRFCSFLCLCFASLPIQFAESQGGPVRKHLMGDLGQEELAEQGYSLNVLAVNDIWGNTTGGLNRGAGIVGNLNISLEVDTEKVGLWSGGQFLVYGIGVYGRQPSKAAGDYQISSSIDSLDTFEPYEAFYAQNLLDDKVNVLAGIHDFTTEFAVLTYTFTLLNSSFYTPPTITQVPASFYPNTSVGTRIKVTPTEESYLFAGLYDGKVTDLERQRAVDLGVSRQGGLYSIGEVGWQSGEDRELYGKLAAGGWYSNTEITDASGNPRSSNFGAYVIGEHQLFGEAEDKAQGLGVFVQGSYSSAERNFNSHYYSAGLSYKGMIDCRDEDVFALGFNTAQSSSQFRRSNPGTNVFERVFEVSYRAKITEYLALTPDVQYIVNPGLNPALDNALVVYVRTELAL